MKSIYLLSSLLLAFFLTSCESNPDHGGVSADDIPEWCVDIEKSGIISSVITPVSDVITGEKFLACGSGDGNTISSSREQAIVDAKKQILDQLIGRMVSKYPKSQLVDGYKSRLNYSSFGYEIVEQEIFDIQSGYQTFILIETKISDLEATKNALLKPRFKNPDSLISD
jgi:hypothetical protein